MISKYAFQLDVKDGVNKAEIPAGCFKYIRSFEVLLLKNGDKAELDSGDGETGLVILSGKCDIRVEEKKFEDLGSRNSVFDGKPTGVYIPRKRKFSVHSYGAEIAVCNSACNQDSEVALVRPEDIKEITAGKDNWARQVRIIIGQSSPSVNLILGETFNPAGNWSGTPAHKHEKVDPPRESLHEELYYFRTDKPQGFGIERFYSYEKDINDLIYLKNHILTFMPWGYHQIVAGPGYPLYYLFFLSGEGKGLTGAPDPGHKWINE